MKIVKNLLTFHNIGFILGMTLNNASEDEDPVLEL